MKVMSILEIIGLLYVSITLLFGIALVIQEWRVNAKTAGEFWDFLRHRKQFKEWLKTRK